IAQYHYKPQKPCETLTDVYNTATYLWSKGNYIESYRLFFELEHGHQFKVSMCAWYQVQCLIRLDHWRQAIAKCHELMEQQPTTSQWYLIASEIYLKQSDFTMAREELLKASLYVPVTDDAYPDICLLKRITFEGVQQHAQRIIRCDFLNVIPYDIACDVFKCLDLNSLVRCTRVSKKWRHFLISSFHLWNELYFSKRAAQLEIKTIHTYLSRLKRTGLTKLSIRHQQLDGDGILMALTQHEFLSDIICTPALFFNVLEYIGSTLCTLQWGGVSIRLNDIIDSLPKICVQLKKLVVHDCFTSLHDVQLHNAALHRLEYFGESFPASFIESIKSLPTLICLETLELSGIHGFTASHLTNILIRCPTLVRLVLNKCLVNIIPIFNILAIACPNLQYFEYDRNRYCQQFDIFHHQQRRLGIAISSQQPKRLEQHLIKKKWIGLKIRLTNMLTDLIVQHILYDDTTRGSLQVLDLSGNLLITDHGLLLENHPMKNLKSLCLKECFGLSSKGVEQAIQQSPLLETIDLSCLSIVNDNILYALVQCKRLSIVDLSYCSLSLVSEDAIIYLIENRKDTLKRLILDYTTFVSTELIVLTIKKLKRGIV
ncbi:hypothetical protein INT47_005679, partial [Mucor saturninus]